MTTPEAFLADIIAHPEDDSLRLIYSDYLSEQGEEERAEFIRVQIELARVPPFVIAKVRRLEEEEAEYQTLSEAYHPEDIRVQELLRRAERYPGPLTKWTDSLTSLVGISTDPPGNRRWRWKWERGFIAWVSCPCAEWLAHGPALARQHPIERVELSGMESYGPTTGGRLAGWWFLLSNRWPVELYHAIPCKDEDSLTKPFRTKEECLDAISAGCLAWARGAASGS